MTDDQLTIEALRRWSQILLWISVLLPVLGGIAAGARYYVERKEKQISSRITAGAISDAKKEASSARRELNEYQLKSAPRRLSPQQQQAIVDSSANFKGSSIAVACRMMDGESCDLGSDLVAAFRAAGCVVPDLVQTSLNDLPGYLAITTHGSVNATLVPQVMASLATGGLNVKPEAVRENSLGAWRADTLYVIVGRKAP